MRPSRRTADELASRRTLATGVTSVLAALLAFGLAIGGPAALKVAAAAIGLVSAVAALALLTAERRAKLRERAEAEPAPPAAQHAAAERPALDDLPADATVVFLGSAREDEEWRRRFETILRPLGRRGVYVAYDAHAAPGSAMSAEVARGLERADAALVLVSPDLLASDAIMGDQFGVLAARGVPVLFVHVRASWLEEAEALAGVDWALDPAVPLAAARDPDGEIVRACKRLAELLPAADGPVAAAEAGVAVSAAARLEPAGRAGELHDVPPLPPEHVERAELAALSEAVLAEGDGAVGITGRAVGLHGQGGIGKTILGAAVARDPELRRHFPDGVFWVTVGEDADVVALQIVLLERLGAASPELRSMDVAASRLRETLADRRCLLVVDDVWTAAAAAAFAVAGPRGRVLYTTRDAALLEPVGADVHRIDVLPEAAARELLARLAGARADALPPAADRVVAATGRVALAVALAGAAVGRGGRDWDEAATELERGGDRFLDHPYADVFKAMDLAVEALDDDLRDAYRSLAVFTRAPLAAVERLWAHLAGATPEQSGARLDMLAARELLVRDGDAIAFHDLQHEFLLLRAGDMRLLHADLLEAYRPRGAPWSSLPPEEPYIWERLVEHLRLAGDLADVRAVASDLAYVAVRCWREGPYAAESELRGVARRQEPDATLDRLIALLARSGHLFAGHASLADVAATIALRAPGGPGPLRRLTRGPLLVPRWGMDDPPEALQRVLKLPRYVGEIAFSPDGATLATTEGDCGTVRLWDPDSGHQKAVLDAWAGLALQLAFSPDGRTLASANNDHYVVLIDCASGEETVRLDGRGPVWGVAFAPDGRLLASCGDDPTVRLWDPATGALVTELPGHTHQVRSVAFTPDGHRLASAGSDREVRLWDPAEGAEIGVLAHAEGVTELAFAPDGRTLASAEYDGDINLWDMATGARTGLLEGHADAVERMAFTSDGRTLASAAGDGTVRLWDVATGALTAVLEGVITDDQPTVAFSPDGRTLASTAAAAEIVRLWDIPCATRTAAPDTYRGDVNGLALAPDGTRLASAGDDGTVRLWDAATGTQTAVLTSHRIEALDVAFAPDGRTLASAGRDGTVRLWDPASGAQRAVLEGHEYQVVGVAFAPNGRLLATCGYDSTLRLWDAATGAQRALIHARGLGDHWLNAITFAPDGRTVASAGHDGTVRLWDPERARETAVLDARGPLVLGVAFASGGRLLASTGHPGAVHLWKRRGRRWGRPAWGLSRRRRRPTAVLEGHVISTSSVAFAPDGRTLASGGGYDGTLRLWDVRRRAPIYLARVGSDVNAVVWGPDGIAVAAGSAVMMLDLVEPGARGRGRNDSP